MKQMLGYSITLSVLPFAVMFVLLAAGVTVVTCAKSRGQFKYFGYLLWNLKLVMSLLSTYRDFFTSLSKTLRDCSGVMFRGKETRIPNLVNELLTI